MKKLTTLLLVMTVVSGYAQPAIFPFKKGNWQMEFYKDSVKTDTACWYFDLKKMQSFGVDESVVDSARLIHGRVYFSVKGAEFLSIPQIKEQYVKDTSRPTIYMIDDEVVKDMKLKIDRDYILRVMVTKSSEAAVLGRSIPEMQIVRIVTNTAENRTGKGWIRGGETAAH